MKTAIIDVGSNSVRYAVLTETTVVAKKQLNSTVLADGLFFSGKLSKEAIARTSDAVKEFCDCAKAEKVDNIFVFATEAVRAAQNGKDFTDAVLAKTGIAVDVIEGAVEAQIGFIGASPDKTKTVAVFDIGGASCEIVSGKNGNITYSKSVPVGCVRLRDGANGERARAVELISAAIPKELPQTEIALGIGGTATALGSMASCPKKYEPEIVHGSIVKKEFLLKVADEFFDRKNMRSLYPALTQNRAKVIGYGALAALQILDALGKSEFTVSERDNIEGYYEWKIKGANI